MLNIQKIKLGDAVYLTQKCEVVLRRGMKTEKRILKKGTQLKVGVLPLDRPNDTHILVDYLGSYANSDGKFLTTKRPK